MKNLLNFCLLLTSFIGYLEWGHDSSTFLFQAEYDILFGGAVTKNTLTHPAIFIPLLGQLLLLFTLFQKRPSKVLTLIALICLGMLMIFLFAIGIMALNFKIAISAVPFLVTGFFVLRYNRKLKHKARHALHGK
jgi:uncharacterized membrane protein